MLKGKKVDGVMSYLAEIKTLLAMQSQAKSVKEFTELEHLLSALKIRSVYQLKVVSEMLAGSKASQSAKTNELFALEIERAVKFHLEYMVIKMAMDHYAAKEFRCSTIKPTLDLLVKVFCVQALRKNSDALYESGFFRQGSAKLLHDSFAALLVELRPHMIPLVETFSVYEGSLQSAIGNEYGDIYELQLELAKNSRLNKNKVPRFYHTLMKPVMTMREPKL